jgi:hypothetical protein
MWMFVLGMLAGIALMMAGNTRLWGLRLQMMINEAWAATENRALTRIMNTGSG